MLTFWAAFRSNGNRTLALTASLVSTCVESLGELPLSIRQHLSANRGSLAPFGRHATLRSIPPTATYFGDARHNWILGSAGFLFGSFRRFWQQLAVFCSGASA